MFQLIRKLTTSELLAGQAPALAGSMVIAELFYKFHSFTLECLAFLATWLVLDAVLQGVGRLARPKAANTGPSAA